MERGQKGSSWGGATLDRRETSARIADYLKREGGLDAGDADRRAEEIVTLIGGGVGMALAPAGALARHWWLFALRGGLAILFGILALVQPLAALTAFVLVFGVWAFIDGVNALALAVSGWRSWQLVLGGLVGIAVGLFTFFRPGITAIALYAAVAAWSIARGILEVAVAVELRKRVRGELWLVFAGIVSILFGALMIALPIAGLLALAWLIGLYALTFGVLMLALSLRLRRIDRVPEQRIRPVPTSTPQPA